jgi:hypothetical protein
MLCFLDCCLFAVAHAERVCCMFAGELDSDDDDAELDDEDESEEAEEPAAAGKRGKQQQQQGPKSAAAAAAARRAAAAAAAATQENGKAAAGSGSEEESEQQPGSSSETEQSDDEQQQEDDSEAAGEEQQQQQQKQRQRPDKAAAANGKAGDKSKAGFYAETQRGFKKEGVTFQDLNLSRPLLRAVSALGYSHPTPIQVGSSAACQCVACVPFCFACTVVRMTSTVFCFMGVLPASLLQWCCTCCSALTRMMKPSPTPLRQVML